ncbi:hypothetical protein O164_04775 [Pseudomonas taiwanensis SJ9]|uniref:Uncharacterized protein n=1 Tax=Pseudomonas taiwanensis SJ9 TaxID=1388762 RepID=V7DGU7_9PSED|nr:hypothetical protein O164_04775 [Pseudomonas taiwanensis SJ9]
MRNYFISQFQVFLENIDCYAFVCAMLVVEL